MLDILKDDGKGTKISFTHSLLPTYIDPQNVSQKKKPFSTFNRQPFSHTLDVILPAEIYDLVREHIEAHHTLQYARVFLSLSDTLSGEFFTSYIKQGNIALLSEGTPLADNRFSLYEGVLRLELDRPTYERCGLQGKPIEDGGRKHQKQRWIVDYDLRENSMQHGKKGFGRLEWAAKEVLSGSRAWLFYNFNPTSKESLPAGAEPISAHAPFVKNVELEVLRMTGVKSPKLSVGQLTDVYKEEESMALLEWMRMLILDSPRVRSSDNIDPFLSRYDVPDFGAGTTSRDFIRLRLRGFIPPQFIRELYLTIRNKGLRTEKRSKEDEDATQISLAEKEEERWLAMSAQGFEDGRSWTVMQFAGRDTLTWEPPM